MRMSSSGSPTSCTHRGIAIRVGAGAPGIAPMVSRASTGASSRTGALPSTVTLYGLVRLQMPIAQSQATAIGYHSSADGGISLSPLGHQGNEGVLQRVFHKLFGGGGGHPLWYALDGDATSALDVGGAPGTNV